MLVGLPGHRGVGKLEAAAEGRCTISVFHSLQRTQSIECAASEIERAFLSPQTRAYVRENDRMRVGRVTGYDLHHENGVVTYEVRFPNGKQRDVSEVDIFVRPWNAPEDPAEILALGGAESQFLHDRRQAALAPLRALTSAAQGLSSLLSSGIDFVPHQVAAVRRVLSDPIQRYLLADEVGLGKTIEAGLIIRQHLIDNPDTEVLIATPPALCDQWRRELIGKLRLDQFGEPFECCSHAEIARVMRTPDVLVVDEAHHLVGLEAGPLGPSAARLRELARDVPVLLLLSATPPLGEEARFLALLNLLDPLTHPLDDLTGFRVKLEQRRAIGRLLLSLDPDASGLVLRQRGAELVRTFPEDPVVQDLAPQLITATREAPERLGNLCGTLKQHVADSYRIHQRLIRSRRADAQGWEFQPRGPEGGALTHVRTEGDPSEVLAFLLATLEDWRSAAVDSLVDHKVGSALLAARYRELLGSISEGGDALRAWLAGASPMFLGEGEILDALREKAADYDDADRIETMVESARRLIKTLRADVDHPKIVVFATAPATAAEFHDALQDAVDGARCLLLVERAGPDADKDVVALFAQAPDAAILTLDRSAEEGLNLSFADAIVHLDLPLSAARIEQRIGRLDRYGRRQNIIRHRTLLPSDEHDSPFAAWHELLAEGLSIFHRSISDVQFLLEGFEAQAFEALLMSGPNALVALAADIRSRVADERKSQDEQYALDRIALAEEPVETFIQALDDAEIDEAALEAGVDQWLIGTLQLKKRPFAWPEEDPFKLSFTKQTLIPRFPWQQQLELDDTRPLSWKRRIATRRAAVTLLRPGTPLIDVLARFTRWDDRGTAFITYRTVPDWLGDAWIGFKLCFTIEPSLDIADLLAPSRAELAASRRAQRYFALSEQTLFIDINGDAVIDPALLAVLSKPYGGHGKGPSADLNLGSRPHILAEFIDPAAFPAVCRRVRDGARQILSEQPGVLEAIMAATTLATSDLQRRKYRLQRRQFAGDTMARDDIALIESILPSIESPSIRLDAMGCFILGNAVSARASRG
ncbi:protein DpdE [Bosea sp. NBC_00550]|uniref:protein DpdE n=1 Tax=Bosea sp. NBC_00550 TaxID=2969621 RepID=UPI00222E1638|nr:protein DpdE [Bosea sp. NBC_00550]UZF90659.1 protein DpdE [Bosea sp. NBC_00550]